MGEGRRERASMPTQYFVAQMEKWVHLSGGQVVDKPADNKVTIQSGALFLAITDNGVAFCDANKAPQVEFRYNQLASWAATKTNFAFVVGDQDDGVLKTQRKYVFKTDQGQEISDMLRNRVNEVYGKLLAAKEGK